MARCVAQQPKSLIGIPVFLAPAFSTLQPCSANVRLFSTSFRVNSKIPRGNRDMNRNRGVSVIRMTGPRHKLSVTKLGPLPKPASDPAEVRAKFQTNPNHGLWGFFNEGKNAVVPPVEEDAFGRAWTEDELSKKSWDDLHRLYWVCVKEANVVRTRNVERKRLRVGYGEVEGRARLGTVKATMRAIRQTLINRHYAYFDAVQLLNEKHLFELFPDVLQRGVDQSLLEPDSKTTIQSEESLPSLNDPLGETAASAERPSP